MHAARPRVRSERRNAVQNAPSSLSLTSNRALPGARRRRRRWRPPGLGHDPVVDAGLAVGGVQEHVWERHARQRAVPERGDLGIQVGADPRHLALADPGVGAQRLDQVIDLPGGRAVQVGLHDHRGHRLIDTAAAFQQRREGRPRAQRRDLQLQVAGGRGQRPRPVAFALGRTPRCADEGPRRSPRSARLRSAPGRSSRPPAGSGHQPRRPSALPAPLAVQTGPGPSCACVLSRNPLAWIPLTITRWPLLARRRRAVRTSYLHHRTGRHPASRGPPYAPSVV